MCVDWSSLPIQIERVAYENKRLAQFIPWSAQGKSPARGQGNTMRLAAWPWGARTARLTTENRRLASYQARKVTGRRLLANPRDISQGADLKNWPIAVRGGKRCLEAVDRFLYGRVAP